MKTGLASVSVAAVLLVGPYGPLSAADTNLSGVLQEALALHAKACRTGKESEIARTMCSYRLATIKNNLADAQMTLTADVIKGLAENLPDLSKVKLLGAVEKGATAALTYRRDAEPRENIRKPKVEFGAVRFVREDGRWKVDASGEYETDKVDESGKESKLDWAAFPARFQVDGTVPEAPRPAAAPDFVGGFAIFCPGYTTIVSVNGVVQDTAVNTSSSGQVKGGLKKGANSIDITITRSGEKQTFKPTVEITYLPAGDGKAQECFSYKPTDSIEGTRTFTFDVK